MPPKASYADRVYTTEVVAFPGATHIGEEKDFTPIINKALELGGYREEQRFHGINGGEEVTTGFGHDAILANADKVVEAVKAGAISHFFLVAGCDGAKPGRNYYTEFVKQTPADSIILPLACGKFRFNAGFQGLWIWDNVMMLMVQFRWQWLLQVHLTVASTNYHYPLYFHGMSKRQSVSC